MMNKILLHTPISFSNNEEIATKIIIDNRSPLNDEHDTASLLSEYDLIVLNYYGNVMMTTNREEQILNFAESGKALIFLLNKFQGERNGTSNYFPIRTLFDHKFIFKELERGDNFIITQFGRNSEFNDYLTAATKKYYVSVDNRFNEQIISLADNIGTNSVAFVSKKYPNCCFLPWIPENEQKFKEIILNSVYGSSKKGEQVTEWVKDFSFPNLIKAKEEINKLQKDIDLIEAKKASIVTDVENYERIRDTLLYRDGKILEDVTKEVLIQLGINVEDGTIGKEDLKFIYDKNHFILEVKGSSGSCQKNKHVGQLKNHISEYETENEVTVKGILIMNAWRKLPIEKRDKEDTKIFPKESVKVAGFSNIALITTQQLFVAYCEHLQGTFFLEDFIKTIQNAKGVVEGYDDIEKYKVKKEV